jgi:hypothetical protein
MPINHEKLKDIASAVQSIVLSIAVVAGGLWTAYTFDALNSRDKAKAELREINRKLKEQALIEAHISAQQRELPGSNNFNIYIVIELTNKGNRNTKIKLGESPLAVTHFKQIPGTDKSPAPKHYPILTFKDTSHSKLGSLDYTVLRAGRTVRWVAWISADQPGLYLVSFQAELSPEEQEVSIGDGMDPTHKDYATAREFVVIK